MGKSMRKMLPGRLRNRWEEDIRKGFKEIY